MTGLEEFENLLNEFKKLSTWAASGGIAMPFIAYFASVIPPFPPGMSFMTAVFQLATIAFAYQKYRGKPKYIITRNMRTLLISLFVILTIYIILFSMFTIYIPTAHRSIVIGFQCKPNTAAVFGGKCPFLSLEDLSGVAFDEFELWTPASIAITRSVLAGVWFSFFIALASFLGQFLVYQTSKVKDSYSPRPRKGRSG
jgi:hypothetical protein